MSIISVESSNPTSLDIKTKKQITFKHLGNLDEKILETFKQALCQLTPRGGARLIRMENLKDKTSKEIVDFIFTYHTEKHGTQTVKMALEKINEIQTRMLIDRDLREATQRRKSMGTKKNEASTSNVMVDKQGGRQVHPSAPNIMVPTTPPVPYSELSAKKVEREKDRDPVLEAPKNKEGTASKNEGPAHNPPKPAMQRWKIMETNKNEASTSKVMVDKQGGQQVHPSAPRSMVPNAPPVPCSELSAKRVEREKDRDPVLEAPKNKEGTASKNEGPAHNPPKPAIHKRKSTVPIKCGASTSKVMVDKQDGEVVTKTVIVIDTDGDDVPCSEPSAKKTKIEQDRYAAGHPKNKGPARNPPKPEQSHSENAPSSISKEKQTRNIIVTHLEKLKEGGIEKFKKILCSQKPPIKNGEIRMSDIKDKSLEEMFDHIIRCHTFRRGPATVRKVLELMKENHIIMLIQKDIRKLSQQKEKPVISSTSPI